MLGICFIFLVSSSLWLVEFVFLGILHQANRKENCWTQQEEWNKSENHFQLFSFPYFENSRLILYLPRLLHTCLGFFFFPAIKLTTSVCKLTKLEQAWRSRWALADFPLFSQAFSLSTAAIYTGSLLCCRCRRAILSPRVAGVALFSKCTTRGQIQLTFHHSCCGNIALLSLTLLPFRHVWPHSVLKCSSPFLL